MKKLDQWHRDNMGDSVIEIVRPTMDIRVRGRVVRCPVVRSYSKFHWRTQSRWLLLVNDNSYGFWNTLKEAKDKFDKDCVPTGPPDDYDSEYFCWHGDKPFGPGPYCTSCGGLIKKDKK